MSQVRVAKVFYIERGEEIYWGIGEEFRGEFIRGEVNHLELLEDGAIQVYVGGQLAMFIPSGEIRRVYFFSTSGGK